MAEPTNVLSPPRPGTGASPKRWKQGERIPINEFEPMNHAIEEEMLRSQKVIEELSELVSSSTALAETQESQLQDIKASNEELEANVSNLKAQCKKLENRVGTLTKQLENDATSHEKAVEEWKRKYDDAQKKMTSLSAERDKANFVADEVRAEMYSVRTAADSSVALAKSQAAEERSRAQSEIDTLRNKVLSLEKALNMKDNELTEMSVSVRTNSDEVDRLKLCEEGLRRKVEDLCLEKTEMHHHAMRRETELEKHIEVLLDRTELLKSQDVKMVATIDDLRAQNEHLTDVNRVLAVRLKAAAAEAEAHKMEVEARQLLQRQNDEMERQIKELRRTITNVIPQRY